MVSSPVGRRTLMRTRALPHAGQFVAGVLVTVFLLSRPVACATGTLAVPL